MDLDSLLLTSLYAFGCLFWCVFIYQRWRWRRRKRLGGSSPGFYPSTVSLGNALHQLHAMAEPQVAYVIEEKLDEEADQDTRADRTIQ